VNFGQPNQINYAASKDALPVAAAGNHGFGVDGYRAGHPEVVPVAATDRNDARAWFSNRNADVEVPAPGFGILSTWRDGGYFMASGASSTTPHVAGVAVVIRTLAPGLTAAQACKGLTSTVENFGAAGHERSTASAARTSPTRSWDCRNRSPRSGSPPRLGARPRKPRRRLAARHLARQWRVI
jgi:subtilisin family serine protease